MQFWYDDVSAGYVDLCAGVTDLSSCLTPTEDSISIAFPIIKNHVHIAQMFADQCQMPGKFAALDKNFSMTFAYYLQHSR